MDCDTYNPSWLISDIIKSVWSFLQFLFAIYQIKFHYKSKLREIQTLSLIMGLHGSYTAFVAHSPILYSWPAALWLYTVSIALILVASVQLALKVVIANYTAVRMTTRTPRGMKLFYEFVEVLVVVITVSSAIAISATNQAIWESGLFVAAFFVMCTATPHTIYSLFHLRHLIKTKMSRNSRDSKSAADLSKVGPSGSVSEFNTTISRDGGRRLGTVKQMTHSRRGSCKQIKSPFQARLTRTSDDKGKIYSLHFTNKANGGNNNSCREAEKKHLSSSPRKRSISIPLDIKESSEENDTMPTLTVPEQRPASSMDNKESPKMISRSRKTSRRESECMNMRPIDTLSPPTNPRRKSSLGNLDAEKMQTTRRYTLTSLSPRSLNMSSNVDQNRTKSISAIPSDAKVRKKGSMISRIVSASKQIVKKTKPRRKEAMKRALNKVSRLGWILIILTILSFPPMIMIIISIISDSGEPYSEKADAFICNYNSESFGRDVVAYAMLVVQQFIQYYSSNL